MLSDELDPRSGTPEPHLRQAQLGHVLTAVGRFLRLRHLASASEPPAETALKRVKDARTKTASSQLPRPLSSSEAKATNGSVPTKTPLTAPQAATRGIDSSSNLRWPFATPTTAQETTPHKKPGYAPIATHISSMVSSGSTISPASTPTGAHAAAQPRPAKTAPRMRFSHFVTAACYRRFEMSPLMCFMATARSPPLQKRTERGRGLDPAASPTLELRRAPARAAASRL